MGYFMIITEGGAIQKAAWPKYGDRRARERLSGARQFEQKSIHSGLCLFAILPSSQKSIQYSFINYTIF